MATNLDAIVTSYIEKSLFEMQSLQSHPTYRSIQKLHIENLGCGASFYKSTLYRKGKRGQKNGNQDGSDLPQI